MRKGNSWSKKKEKQNGDKYENTEILLRRAVIACPSPGHGKLI